MQILAVEKHCVNATLTISLHHYNGVTVFLEL